MKQKIKNFWWHDVVTSRENVVGMDAAILMHPKTWEASGHVSNFHDPLVDCKNCKARYRADHVDLTKPCERCGKKDWTEPRQFNLMFKTAIGPIEDSGEVTYLRPETAQGIFVNFMNVQGTSRQKLPFGIAQLGKAFRNEITTGNFLFRTREFEQMELEFFIHPGENEKWLDYWCEERLNWFKKLGINPEKLRLRPHDKDELAHYSTACFDVEYEFPFGWSELEGIADRGTFDLDQHNEYSGKKQQYFDPQTNERIIPAVVESSAGVDRTFLTCLVDAYCEEEVRDKKRIVLKLDPKIAPITCAVLPLVKKDGLPEIAQKIVEDIRTKYSAFFDQGGSIGRRYRRQDEAGTPYGVTVDHQTTEDGTVTLRDRDTMDQVRISTDNILSELQSRIQ
jgi:glycyl-tRNA synthetase